MDPAFDPGDTAYVRRTAVVDADGEERLDPIGGEDAPVGPARQDGSFETVLQEVRVLEIRGARAVVAHSGSRYEYHVAWLQAEPDGPGAVKPREWNP